MKSLLTLFLFIAAYTAAAQKIYIPYRTGNLFGLSDENGKMIVAPQYDYVSWMEGGWFSTRKKIELKDTLETSPGRFFIRNSITTVTGLIHNGAVILKEEPFNDYEIVAGKCIVAEFQSRTENLTKEQFKKYGNYRRFISIFNLQGKNLYPENFRRIQKVDTAGISKDKKTARYILFVGIGLNERYNMFVFDADQQKISDWLVKDAFKIEADRKRSSDKQISFNITDKSAAQNTQVLDYSSGRFVLSASPATSSAQAAKKRNMEEQVEVIDIGPGGYDPPAIPMEEGKTEMKKPAFNPYHIIIKDTLYYLTGYEDRHPVKLSTGGKIIFTQPKGITQYQPVIVKNNNRFYIVKQDKLSEASYDSLIYFGTNFLAWQQVNGKTKAGMINTDGTAIIPLEYDSVYADIRYFNLKDKNPASNKPNYIIELTEADSKYNYDKPYPYKRNFSNFLTVFKEGKCGLITVKGETTIPIEYEMIAKNNLQHSRPKEDEFLILKQQDKFGIATLEYSREKKRPELLFIVPPTFKYIPGFFYPNYYGIKNYKLIGLYSEQMEFKGYASQAGKLFYTE